MFPFDRIPYTKVADFCEDIWIGMAEMSHELASDEWSEVLDGPIGCRAAQQLAMLRDLCAAPCPHWKRHGLHRFDEDGFCACGESIEF